jgi:hypothetical protein
MSILLVLTITDIPKVFILPTNDQPIMSTNNNTEPSKTIAHRHYNCVNCPKHLVVFLDQKPEEWILCGHCEQKTRVRDFPLVPQVCLIQHWPEPKAK